MTRTQFLIIMVVFAALIFIGMWLGWRRRSRRDTSISVAAPPLTGELLAVFQHASYVSTTLAGAPLERLAIPGLKFKGFADVEVRTDGVEIAVTGEEPVSVPASRVLGTSVAGRRIGKAVEKDGLSLLRWTAPGVDGELESSFRLSDPAEQRRFAEAIDRVASHPAQTQTADTSQEDA